MLSMSKLIFHISSISSKYIVKKNQSVKFQLCCSEVPLEEQCADEMKDVDVDEWTQVSARGSLAAAGREARICCWKRSDRIARSVGRELKSCGCASE